MNRSESKYFATAEKMDAAFLALLERKSFAYLTVKELCAAAGVNRSTFYLHYETMGDLLAESVRYMNRQFLAYMAKDCKTFASGLDTAPQEKLYLLTPEYLMPYLRYIRDHRRLFRTAVDNAQTLGLADSYDKLFRHIFTPILDRFAVPEQERDYRMAFYIQGLLAIITQWLKKDCADSVESVAAVMRRCVMGTSTGERSPV